MKESDLFPPLKKWLNAKGFKVYAEVAIPFIGGAVDVVADREDMQCAYELKLCFSGKVIEQAQLNQRNFKYSYIVVPVKINIEDDENEKVGWCYRFGIGIIQIRDNVVKEILPAKLSEMLHPESKRIDFKGIPEAETAGLKTRKGIGPAIMCLERIKEYVRRNPATNWFDIYENVHNHYANVRSLKNNMEGSKEFNLKQYQKQLKEGII